MTEETLTLASMAPAITSAGAILLSALLAGLYASHTIHNNREIARKRATLDLIASRRWDHDFLQAESDFVTLRDSPSGLAMWASPEHANSPQITTIKNRLNDYELIAVGIRQGILDENFYKQWFRGSVILNWRKSKEFVEKIRIRENRDEIFCELQMLAECWERDQSVQHSSDKHLK